MSESKVDTTIGKKNHDDDKNESFDDAEYDPHFEPIISMPEVAVPTLEEDETVILSLRAKLYRYDVSASPPEWKERGTGIVKMLQHKFNDTIRVVMRRDKTLKLCANHLILPHIILQPSTSCERAWVYSAKDFSDETMKSELLAIKFSSVENAQKWKDTFEECKKIVSNYENLKRNSPGEKKILIKDSPKLSDTFEEEKKSLILDKKDEKVEVEKEQEADSPKNVDSIVAEKLSSMTIKSN